MAISLTCVCGALLEIDDSFKGRKIPCPDCNRLLDTTPPLAPPKITNGWALTGFIVSLAGMLTIIGPIVGAVCGFVGYRQIRRDPTQGGLAFAKASLVMGAVFSFLGVWAFAGPEFFGIDGYLRLFVGAKDLKFPPGLKAEGHKLPGDVTATLLRPNHAWGIHQGTNTENAEDLSLVNLWEDAHIAIFGVGYDEQDKAEDCRREAITAFLKTPLMKTLTKSPEPPPYPTPGQIKILQEEEKTPRSQMFQVEFVTGSIPRVFLFHLFSGQGPSRLYAAVGGARQTRFGRLEDELRKALESSQHEKRD